MDSTVANFLRIKQIDSYQKLRVLLFLHQHPKLSITLAQLAEQLYLGYLPALEKIINDLRQTGLIDCVRSLCRLNDDPETRSSLRSLTHVFEDPLARQEILGQIENHQNCVEADARRSPCFA